MKIVKTLPILLLAIGCSSRREYSSDNSTSHSESPMYRPYFAQYTHQNKPIQKGRHAAPQTRPMTEREMDKHITIASPAKSKSYYRRSKKTAKLNNASATEYVNRVGQKVLLVSDRSDPVRFIIANDTNIYLEQTESGEIAISKGLLMELSNEAELASALSSALVPTMGAPGEDEHFQKKSLEYVFRAGYDPKAHVSTMKKLYPHQDFSGLKAKADTFPAGQQTKQKAYQGLLRYLK